MNRTVVTLILLLFFTLAVSIGPRNEYYDDGNKTCYPKSCKSAECMSWNSQYYILKYTIEDFIDRVLESIIRKMRSEKNKAISWSTRNLI